MDIPVLKQVNGKAVIEALRRHGKMGRKEIAEATGLSIPTVWRLINELMEAGIVKEVASPGPNKTPGRKTNLIDINSDGGWVVAVDVGASHVTAAATDLTGVIFDSVQKSLEGLKGEEAVSPVIASAVRKIVRRTEKLRGAPKAVGICVTGTVDYDLGIVKLSFNLQLEDFHIAELVRGICDVPIVTQNVIEGATLAEARLGHGRANPSFAYVSIGVGVGSAYVLNREIYNPGTRGEFGLTVVAPEGDPNRFGGIGYLEALASGSGIAASARRAIEAGADTIVGELVQGNLQSITARIVAEAAKKGDKVALDIFARAAEYLAIAIVNASNILGLRLFVLNGGVSKSGDIFWNPLREAIDRYEYFRGEITVEPSDVPDDATILGAGFFALDRVFDTIM